MKKQILFLAVAIATMSVSAQQLLIINNEQAIALSDFDHISYEANPTFADELLPGKLTSDPNITIFSEALKLTGLADSLLNVADPTYPRELAGTTVMIRGGSAESAYSRADYRPNRPRRYTIFVETDDVLHAAGINNLEDLKAWAKKTYDAVFPEDADISDPTDRSNSLNRFVAYHILRHSPGYAWLVGANDKNTVSTACFIGTVRDASAYYETMMPYASIKCSYPTNVSPVGIYLNRHGLQENCTVRGAHIVADDQQEYEHVINNGIYYYIDQLIAYDNTTQKQVLDEAWRVDFKALSPDIMNIVGIGANQDMFYAFPNGFVENYQSDGQLVAYHPFSYWWNCYEGDGLLCPNAKNITVKLPPLPNGKWQVRLGYTASQQRPIINTYIDGALQFKDINLKTYFYDGNYDDYTMPGIDDYAQGATNPLSQNVTSLRRIIGTVESNGKNDHFLRIEVITEDPDSYLLLDYLELVPIK